MFDPRGGKNAFTTLSSIATGHAQGGFTAVSYTHLTLPTILLV